MNRWLAVAADFDAAACRQALVNPASIARVEHRRAGHVFPGTQAEARDCGSTEPPFVRNCGFDAASYAVNAGRRWRRFG